MNNQEVTQGWGSFSKLFAILDKHRFQRILFITGKRSFNDSIAHKMIENHRDSYTFIYFNEFSANPKLPDVYKGIEVCRSLEPQVIVAIGGGSVMDMAKLINALSPITDDLVSIIEGRKKINTIQCPLIAVPTTAGSGSEATHFAVVYMNNEKYSLTHPLLVPKTVILDPELTTTSPKYLTACAAMDALAQGIESFWSIHSTEKSRDFSENAIKLAINNIKKVVNNPDLKSREEMQKAAYFAGKAINISKTTAPHAFSYYLTSKHNIPHGHAVALTLGWVFQENLKINNTSCNDKRGPKFVSDIFQKILKLLNIEKENNIQLFFHKLMDDIGLDSDLFPLTTKNRSLLLKNVNKERLKNNPVSIS